MLLGALLRGRPKGRAWQSEHGYLAADENSLSTRPPMRRLLPLLALLTAACQPLPHPLAGNVPPPDSPILSPRDSAGILVLPVAGAPAPLAADLAEAMAAALREAQIPASTHGRNKRSYELSGTASEERLPDGRPAWAIEWVMRGADGKPLGRVPTRSEQPAERWPEGGAALAKEIAAADAPALARLVQDEPPVASGTSEPTLSLRPVTGAPGDGGNALTRAMDNALRRARITLGDPRAEGGYVLAGTVKMSPPVAGQQQVKVNWSLLGTDGKEIGQINQENAVPAGSLDGAWGDIAYAVANAAAPGVLALIERAKAAAIGS